VPVARNRKVVRQFAGNPKGRWRNHHGRSRLQRRKRSVRISDVCSLPCVFNGSDPHMIRGGGCPARATTKSKKRATPCESEGPSSFSHSACARQSPLSRRFVAASLVRGIWIVSESYESDPDERDERCARQSVTKSFAKPVSIRLSIFRIAPLQEISPSY